MTNKLAAILERHDAGQDVETLARDLSVSPGYVYSTLREHRPTRARKPRKRTSDKPRLIAGLAAQGIKAARIAFVLDVSAAYVHRHKNGTVD